MKKIRKAIDSYIDQIEQKWKALPDYRQRLLTKIFFAVYLLLSVFVLLHIWLKPTNTQKILPGTSIKGVPSEPDIKKNPGIHSHQKTLK
ncbi:hypothetical protein SAMN05421594_2784 [Chryseobacterium oleae]|uniref:Nitrogen regulatory IIA protein n=1 Tax=Chryseobacterium oleae TaxID=491207 RepID=A0A1I4YZ80_CHROL|nr:hypothetical protein [Chryseobacterium oleae]SFN43247.1 hypothetical protein SAMN05421594_2784 [Chryseobacterium oleae]